MQALASAPLTQTTTQTAGAVLTNAQLATGNLPLTLLSNTPIVPGSVGTSNPSVLSPSPTVGTLTPFELAVTSAIQAGNGKSSAEHVYLRLDLFSKFKDPSCIYVNHDRNDVFGERAFQGQQVTSESFVANCTHIIGTSTAAKRIVQGTPFATNIPSYLKKMFQLEGARGCSTTIFLREAESQSVPSDIVAAAGRYIQLVGFLLGEEVYGVLHYDILASFSAKLQYTPVPASVLLQHFDHLFYRLFSSRESTRIRVHMQANESLRVWIEAFKCTDDTLVQLQGLAIQQHLFNLSYPEQQSDRSGGPSPQPPKVQVNKDKKKTDQKKKPQGKNLGGLKGFCSSWLKTDSKPCGNPVCKQGSKIKLKHETEFALLSKPDRESIITEANKLFPNEIKVTP